MIPHVVPGVLITAAEQNALIDLVNTSKEEIELLKTTGGGTPGDPYVNWYAGDGPPPDVVPGAGRGDMYFDRVAGNLYQLN